MLGKKLSKAVWRGCVLVILLVCLYVFICSISILSASFRLLFGRKVRDLLVNSEVLRKPIVGVMIGLLVTVLVQSSSTSTSVIVGLVSAGQNVSTAIPMVMGANIGTSITNTIVSLSQVNDKEEFRRAFSCATIHDMFNWMNVLLLLILEMLSGFIEKLTGALVDSIGNEWKRGRPKFINNIAKPFVGSIVELNEDILEDWARNSTVVENMTSLLKTGCKTVDGLEMARCPYLFSYLGPEGYGVPDVYLGLMLCALALAMLYGGLLGSVRCLYALLGDGLENVISQATNKDIPIRGLGWLTGYLYMLMGAVATIFLQSSSVFTSVLTPLVGRGLISLERAYPLTLGSNIGTTTTSLFASLAVTGKRVNKTLQIALVHLVVNLLGLIIFYPIPMMRWPIPIAKKFGVIVSKYRWFSLLYLTSMFVLLPLLVFGISLGGPLSVTIILIPVFILVVVFLLLINIKCFLGRPAEAEAVENMALNEAAPVQAIEAAAPVQDKETAAPVQILNEALPAQAVEAAAHETSSDAATPESSLEVFDPKYALGSAALVQILNGASTERSSDAATPVSSVEPAAPKSVVESAVTETASNAATSESSIELSAPKSVLKSAAAANILTTSL